MRNMGRGGNIKRATRKRVKINPKFKKNPTKKLISDQKIITIGRMIVLYE